MVRFYHLMRSSVETALEKLLRRALEAGHRVELRGTDRARLDWLDRKLWLSHDDAFLPHGLDGGPHDASQPILLTLRFPAGTTTDCVMAVDGAEIEAAEARRLSRVCILFDGREAAELERARAQWRGLAAADVPAEYWSEETGRWQLKSGGSSGEDR